MRFMIIVKATKNSEAGVMPEEKLFADMAAYHEELTKAGVLVDASGLHPSSKGWRVQYKNGQRTVIDGPFTETNELIAGYTTIQVGSREEALAWARRFPNPAGDGLDAQIEVRQLFELDDFGDSPAIERFRRLEQQKIQKITPFLWFDQNAEEAAQFYTSIFKNSRITEITRYGNAASGFVGIPKNRVMTVTFELEGQPFIALNGGPMFKFTPAISLFVNCSSQQEVDELWDKLCAGGEPGQCGWLQDKFGVSWQIVPAAVHDLLHTDDAEKSERVMQALITMNKIELSKLEQAHHGA